VGKAAERVIAEAEAKAPKTAAERQREWRERKAAKAANAAPVSIETTEADAEAAGELGAVLWDVVGPMMGCASLDDSQKKRLGTALAPLIKKYMPLLGEWQYEAAAVLCILALARETHVPPKVREVEQEGDEHGDIPAAGQ
jgi:hypothetical protein